MTAIIMIPLGIAIVALVCFAIYQQVRAHLELRQSIRALERNYDRLIDRMGTVVGLLENVSVEKDITLRKPIWKIESISREEVAVYFPSHLSQLLAEIDLSQLEKSLHSVALPAITDVEHIVGRRLGLVRHFRWHTEEQEEEDPIPWNQLAARLAG